MNIQQKLDALDDFQCQLDFLTIQKKELIDSILTPEIRQKLADIETEFSDKAQAVQENIEKLTNEIKADVLAGRETVKGSHSMAVWVKGRVTWDTKQLDSLIPLIPQLAKARKEGEPSVTIRHLGN